MRKYFVPHSKFRTDITNDNSVFSAFDNSFNKSYGEVEYWKNWEQYTERNKQFNPYVGVEL